MREIQLTKGFVALVDDEDFESVSAYRWRVLICKRAFYAIRTVRIDGKRMSEGMHRFILGVTDPKIQVDHENHDGLDNRRHNLRLATCSQNCANQRMTSRNKSGFKGVCWNKVAKKWSAEIWANRKKTYLGLFATPEQASDVYLEAVQKLHGEFALRRVEMPDTRASHEVERTKTMNEKKTISDAIELLGCAEINCDNVKKLGAFFADAVKMQIKEAIGILEALE